MLVNVTDVFTSEGKVLTQEFAWETAEITHDQDALEEQEAFMEGYSLNIDSLIDNEITTSWPMKVLCRPDCKGLCPVCGKDLNTGACGCDTFVPDPRMAAIMDVFNANKEV